jgi:hypothetical protein
MRVIAGIISGSNAQRKPMRWPKYSSPRNSAPMTDHRVCLTAKD